MMAKYTIKVDPKLNVKNEAFGARVDHDNIFIPSKLAQILKSHPLGDDAVTVAGFLASFPTSVAVPLGLSAEVVINATQAFIKLLESSGADVSSAQRLMVHHTRGARHPGELNRGENHQTAPAKH